MMFTKQAVRGIAVIALIALLSAASFARNSVWKDEYLLWNDTIKKSPAKARGFTYLGIASAKGKNHQQALGYFLEAKARNALDLEVRHNLGILYYDTGRPDLAVSELEAAIALRPEIPKLHAALAVMLENAGNISAAIGQYREALRLAGENRVYHIALAMLFIKAEQYAEAAEIFKSMLRLDPADMMALNSLGNIALLHKSYPKALSYYQAAAAASPADPEPLYNMAITYEKLGDPSLALSYYRGFLGKAGSDFPAQIADSRARIEALSRQR